MGIKVFLGLSTQQKLALSLALPAPQNWAEAHSAELWCFGVAVVLLLICWLTHKALTGHQGKDEKKLWMIKWMGRLAVFLIVMAIVVFLFHLYLSTHPDAPAHPYGNL